MGRLAFRDAWLIRRLLRRCLEKDRKRRLHDIADARIEIEVYVRPFPGPGGKWQISTTGGTMPTWAENGRELFYRTLDSRIMVVTYSVEGDSFRAGRPRLWSEGQFTDRGINQNFALHPDGKRFAGSPPPVGIDTMKGRVGRYLDLSS